MHFYHLFLKTLKFSVIFIFFLIAKTYAITSDGYDAGKWLDKDIPYSLLAEIENCIENEKVEDTLKNPGSKINFGQSLPGLNDTREPFLIEVSNFKKNTNQRPRVAEIGPGFGNMTWKMLAAGATVDAIEIQIPTAQQMQLRLRQLNTLFWGGLQLDEILNVYFENVLELFVGDAFNEKYDLIWLGNVIHLLSPDDLKKLSSLLLKVLKPNGKVFFEASSLTTKHSNLIHAEIIQIVYDKALKDKAEFPGFFAVNLAALINNFTHQLECTVVISAKNHEQMLLLRENYEMQSYEENYFALDPNDQRAHQIINDLQKTVDQSYGFQKVIPFHRIINYIEKESIQRFFIKNGFTILDTFYIDRTGKKINKSKKGGAIGISLQKPFLAEGEISLINLKSSKNKSSVKKRKNCNII